MTGGRSAYLNVMTAAAEKAGRALTRDFGEVEQLQVSRKGPGDFVSAADKKSEKILVEELQKARPTYGFLLEEGGEIKGTDPSYRWIIDPLDGTTNFLHGLPHWCISIALEKDREIVSAVIHDPIKHEIFTAEKGAGAFSDGKRMRVAGRNTINEALISIGVDQYRQALNSDANAFAGALTRRMGSACLDLAYVAAGRLDAYCERGLKPWDTAAGGLMVREAGGYVSDIGGGKDFVYSGTIAAANPTLHAEFIKKLNVSDKKETVAKTAT